MDAVLVYDGDCGICEASVRLLVRAKCRATPIPSQAWLLEHPDDELRCAAAALLVTDDAVLEGEHAVAGALRLSAWPGPWLGRLIDAPGVRILARHVYRLVARNRARISSAFGLQACTLEHPVR